MEPDELKINLIQEGMQELSELQKEILALLSAERNGLSVDDLYKKIITKFTEVEKTDLGPDLFAELYERELVVGFWLFTSEERGAIIAYRLKEYTRPSPKVMKICNKRGHDVPRGLAYEAQGALMRGGYCRRCHKLIELEFLGNVFTKEENSRSSGYDISAAIKRGLKVFKLR